MTTLLAAGDVPGGLSTVLVALITALGGIGAAFVGVYRQQRHIRTEVNGRMTELLRQLEEEHERSLDLARQVATYEERERLRRRDDTT